MTPANEPVLIVDGVSKSFGGVRALNNVAFTVPPAGIVGVIGPNGSGKTTLFNIMSGFLPPDRGRVLYRGMDITRLGAERTNRLGLGRTFQITRLFNRLSALENLTVVGRGRASDILAQAHELLNFVQLQHIAHEYAERLSYGQQKLIEIARLLMTDPRLLLLDEPFAGLNPLMEARLLERLHDLIAQGRAIIVTDHDMKIMLGICSTIFVLDSGELISHGPPEVIREDPRVLDAYFGH